MRCPLPPGGSARIKTAPQWGQVDLSASPMEQFSPAHGTILPPIWELRQFQKIGAPQEARALRCRRLNVRRWRTEARPRALFVNLRFKIGRFFQQGGGNRGVFGYFGELEQNRRLTHEILSTDHGFFPRGIPAPTPLRGSRAFVPVEC